MNSSIKKKLFENGFNILDYLFIGGRCTIVIVVYLPQFEKAPQTRITATDLDIYNALLMTCRAGSKLQPVQQIAFFPDLEETAQELIKRFPSHFKTNKYFSK